MERNKKHSYGNDSEQIVSAKKKLFIIDWPTKKYKVYDDDYNVLFEFQREEIYYIEYLH